MTAADLVVPSRRPAVEDPIMVNIGSRVYADDSRMLSTHQLGTQQQIPEQAVAQDRPYADIGLQILHVRSCIVYPEFITGTDEVIVMAPAISAQQVYEICAVTDGADILQTVMTSTL